MFEPAIRITAASTALKVHCLAPQAALLIQAGKGLPTESVADRQADCTAHICFGVTHGILVHASCG